MARLASDTWVKDPRTRLMVHLRAGEEPSPEYAALVTNPDAWEDGKLPSSAKPASTSETGDDGDGDTKQAATKRAARKPATRRASADEGDGGK